MVLQLVSPSTHLCWFASNTIHIVLAVPPCHLEPFASNWTERPLHQPRFGTPLFPCFFFSRFLSGRHGYFLTYVIVLQTPFLCFQLFPCPGSVSQDFSFFFVVHCLGHHRFLLYQIHLVFSMGRSYHRDTSRHLDTNSSPPPPTFLPTCDCGFVTSNSNFSPPPPLFHFHVPVRPQGSFTLTTIVPPPDSLLGRDWAPSVADPLTWKNNGNSPVTLPTAYPRFPFSCVGPPWFPTSLSFFPFLPPPVLGVDCFDPPPPPHFLGLLSGWTPFVSPPLRRLCMSTRSEVNVCFLCSELVFHSCTGVGVWPGDFVRQPSLPRLVLVGHRRL